MKSFIVENNTIMRFPNEPKKKRDSLLSQLRRLLLPSKQKTINIRVGPLEKPLRDPIMIFCSFPDSGSARTGQEKVFYGFIMLTTQRTQWTQVGGAQVKPRDKVAK